MLMTRTGVEARNFLTGKRVQITADALDSLRNCLRRAIRGSFEDEVFDKMANAIQRGRFVARAHADPKPQTDTAHLGHRSSGNGEAIFQSGYLVHAKKMESGPRLR